MFELFWMWQTISGYFGLQESHASKIETTAPKPKRSKIERSKAEQSPGLRIINKSKPLASGGIVRSKKSYIVGEQGQLYAPSRIGVDEPGIQGPIFE